MTPLEQHQLDAGRFATLVEAAAEADWDRPTPVPEWTARDVVSHVVTWLPGFLERTDLELAPVDVAADPAAAWRERTVAVQLLLEHHGEVEFQSPMFGTTTLARAIDQFYTADVWMHSWDLAMALGQTPALGEERCAAALAGMEPMDDVLRSSGQFGPRVAVPDDATAQDRLMGFLGRDPAWQPA